MSSTHSPAIPQPVATPETQAYWAAFAEGRFLLPRCGACQAAHWYPRSFCPFCFSADVQPVEARGEGTVYSFSVTAAAEPLIVAYVELAEGPRMLTNLVGMDPQQVRIGMPVKLVWRATDAGGRVPFFGPA